MGAPDLLFIIGAPAVGKATVARAVAARTGFGVFTNHASLEPFLPLFGFGDPAFVRLSEGMRHAVFREVAASDLPGLIFTFVWAFDLESEEDTVAGYAAPFRERGGRVLFAELRAPLAVRLERNRSPQRLMEKPSKRDVEQAEAILLQHEADHRFVSDGEFDGRDDHILVDNTDLSPDEAAERIIDALALERP